MSCRATPVLNASGGLCGTPSSAALSLPSRAHSPPRPPAPENSSPNSGDPPAASVRHGCGFAAACPGQALSCTRVGLCVVGAHRGCPRSFQGPPCPPGPAGGPGPLALPRAGTHCCPGIWRRHVGQCAARWLFCAVGFGKTRDRQSLRVPFGWVMDRAVSSPPRAPA